MAKKELRRVKTLSGFIKWAAQFNDGQYLFRGVSKDCYEVEASAYRRLPKAHRSNSGKLLEINRELIEDARSRGHDQKNSQPLSDLELLAELQHFGAATCLIDFSRSALVALWFACQQSSTGKAKNGKVFAVYRDRVRIRTVNPQLTKEDIDYFFKPDENGNYPLYQWEPKLQNNRIIAQQSVFLFSGAQIEVETECVIMQSSKQKILESLEELSGITEADIFPDFDGFARVHAQNRPRIEPDVRGYRRRGIETHQRGDLDNAIAYYTEIIRLDPADASIVAEAYNNRGAACYAKHDYDRALEDYTKAIGYLSSYISPYTNRGLVYCDKGDYDLAVEDYAKVINLKPDAAAYNNRGAAYRKKGDYDLAIVDHMKAKELNPDNDNIHNDYRMWIAMIIENCDEAIRINPNDATLHYNRGLAWLHLQVWEKAKTDLTIAVNMEADIIALFHNTYENVPEFEQKNGVRLPADIAEMLTPQQ